MNIPDYFIGSLYLFWSCDQCEDPPHFYNFPEKFFYLCNLNESI